MRAERKPPVRAPDAIEFHGSSFCRKYTSVQSKLENKPPQTAKLPPMRGACLRTACKQALLAHCSMTCLLKHHHAPNPSGMPALLQRTRRQLLRTESGMDFGQHVQHTTTAGLPEKPLLQARRAPDLCTCFRAAHFYTSHVRIRAIKTGMTCNAYARVTQTGREGERVSARAFWIAPQQRSAL